MDDKQATASKLARWFQYQPLPLNVVAGWDWLQRIARPGNQFPLAANSDVLSCQPLFIVSAGRSGTTLLRSMLVAGGEVAIPVENHALPVAIRRFKTLQRLDWPDLSRLIVGLFASHVLYPHWDVNPVPLLQEAVALPERERSLARLIDLVFQQYQLAHFPEAKLWGEQSPLNTLYLHWIRPVFPNARYLHLLRDGRDVVASMVNSRAGASTVEDACRRWNASVKHVQRLAKRLTPAQFLEIRYEALVQEPQQTLLRVADFCQISYSEQMLDYWKMPTTIEHKVLDHHRNLGKPLFADSIGRWRQRLDANQQAYVQRELAVALRQCGYDALD